MKGLRAGIAIQVRDSADPPTSVSTHGTDITVSYPREGSLLKLTLSGGVATGLTLWGVVDGDWVKLMDVGNTGATIGGDGASLSTSTKYAIEIDVSALSRIALQRSSDAVTVVAKLHDSFPLI